MFREKYMEFFGCIMDGNRGLWLLEKEMPKEFYLDPIVGEDEEFYIEYRKPYIHRLISASVREVEKIKEKYQIEIEMTYRHKAVEDLYLIDICDIRRNRRIKEDTKNLIKRYRGQVDNSIWLRIENGADFKLGYCIDKPIGDTDEFFQKYRHHIGKTICLSAEDVSNLQEDGWLQLRELDKNDPIVQNAIKIVSRNIE